jgi:GGDEF domain-containing protein
VSGRTLVGVLTLYSSNKDAYSEDHERIIEVVARQVSAAILEAQKGEKVRTRSFKDETTGLPNLRHLIEFIEVQLAGEERRHSFCLVTIQFEASPASGAIQATESVISGTRRALRPADLLFSSGPNELVALLLNTELDAATAIRVRLASALSLLKSDGALKTVKLGLACAPVDAADAERLLVVSRDRALKTGPTGISPPEAIH